MRALQPLPAALTAQSGRLVERAVTLVEGAAFWTAVVLPFVALPVLGAAAVPVDAVLPAPVEFPVGTRGLLVGLLGADAVALVIGHGYGSREPEADR